MRKTITKLFGLVFALFASQGIMAQSELLLDEPFAGSLGSFTIEGSNGIGNDIWLGLDGYVQADACGKIGENEYFEDYIVSPEINLASDGVASFEFYWRYFQNFTTEVNFAVREIGGMWQSIPFEAGESITWNNSGELAIPESFNGKTIQVGFKYSAPNSPDSGQFQLKNLKVYGVKGTAEKIDADLYYGASEVTYKIGSGDFHAPVLDNPYGVEVVFTSSDVNVATIDAQGAVTINGVGVTTITATSVETDKYLSSTASYVLKVEEGSASNVIFEETFTKSLGEFVVEGFNGVDPNNPIWVYEGYAKADAYDKIKEPVENYLVSPVFKLTNAAVAHFNHAVDYFNDAKSETGFCIRTVGGEWQALNIPTYPENPGMVVSTGNIEIPAEFIGLDVQVAFRYSAQASNTAGIWSIQNLAVESVGGSSEKADPALSFAETDVIYMLESGDFAEPVLNNPNNVAVTYTSSNEEVATVNAETGEVTVLAEGTVTIKAVSEETEQYLAGEASYNITVTAPAVTEVIFSETFETSLGEFTVEGYNGDYDNIWSHDVAFVTADAYGKISEPVENYLVSPVIKLGDESHIAHFAYSQTYFNNFAEEAGFVVRTVGGEWQKIELPKYSKGGDWEETGKINIPEELRGMEVQFGFRYSAQASASAGLWSISDFAVEKVCVGTDPKLAFNVEDIVALVGQEFTAPELINEYGVEVSYTSSNPEVATVDAMTGAVEILAEGTTTITATSVATDKFVSGKASYNITVKKASAEDVIFEAYFEENMCGFSVEGFNGDEMPIWKMKDGAVRADAFTKVSEPTTNYLVSPTIRMSETENTAEFNYKYMHDINSQTAAEEEFGFCIREVGGEWEKLIIPNFDASNTMVNSGKVVIPAAYAGKQVQVAFMYFAESGQTSGVLTVDDIVIRKAIPTSIEGITADDLNNGKVYDLQGRRVDQLGKGIYIVNGKKIVVK